MSTRSNILIKDQGESLLFYRHSDGYPTGQVALLTFMQAIKDGKLRNNVSQSAGWLIVLGHTEYAQFRNMEDGMTDWKVGAYEPTDWYGSDIEYFYILDLTKMTIEVYTASMWGARLRGNGLRSEKNIKKCIEKGWLRLMGTITEFNDPSILQKIEEVSYQ